MQYDRDLIDIIEKEKNGEEYIYSASDRKILDKMLSEINEKCETSFKYLAEIDAFETKGMSSIVLKYIDLFSSESVKGYLAPKLLIDGETDMDKTVLRLYLGFKKSDYYISDVGKPAPSHIYVRYDNIFARIKNKSIMNELLELVKNPRDAYYLPFTCMMLAAWRIPELKDIMIRYLTGEISLFEIGLTQDGNYFPSLRTIKRELKFIALQCLKYYPCKQVEDALLSHFDSEDKDISILAKKIHKHITK